MSLDTRWNPRAMGILLGALALGHAAPAGAQGPAPVPPGMVCIPGAQVTCGCVGGQGVQVCKQDGSGLDPCQCAAAAPPAPFPPPLPPIPFQGAGEELVPPPPSSHGRGLLLAGVITGAVGGVVTVAGIAVLGLGVAANDAAQAQCTPEGRCSAADLSSPNDAHTKTTAGAIVLGAGAPALVAGVIMIVVGANRSSLPGPPSARSSPVEPRLTSVGLTPGGVVLGGTF